MNLSMKRKGTHRHRTDCWLSRGRGGWEGRTGSLGLADGNAHIYRMDKQGSTGEHRKLYSNQFSSVQPLSRVRLFATPWTAARQASLSITISRSLLKLMSIKSVMPSNHLILCRPLLLLPPILPSIRVFSSESVLCIRWPKDWSFSFSINPHPLNILW